MLNRELAEASSSPQPIARHEPPKLPPKEQPPQSNAREIRMKRIAEQRERYKALFQFAV
jgi:hypothetical protein